MYLRMLYLFFPVFSLKRMENKFISRNTMDIFFTFVCCIAWCPNAVDCRFISLRLNLKFVWLKQLALVPRRGFPLFLCLLMLPHLLPVLEAGQGTGASCMRRPSLL